MSKVLLYFAAFIESRFRSSQSSAKSSPQAESIPFFRTLADICAILLTSHGEVRAT